MKESVFWRPRNNWLNDPTCDKTEATWILYLLEVVTTRQILTPITISLDLPRMRSAKSIIIQRHHPQYIRTGLVLDSKEPSIIGAITGLGHEQKYPLRPLRPNHKYDIESEMYLELAEALNKNGFDESDNLLSVTMALLHQLSLPVNKNLPTIVATHWPE